ncbi:MAG: hypothetical protein KJ622_10715 [Alphaproteobacteria bacterium]|nr:hypothetical protein [Alphaproteobacteria bacterium]
MSHAIQVRRSSGAAPVAAAASALWVFGAGLAQAAEPALDLSGPLAITCETSAVLLDSDPFVASQGAIDIELRLDDAADPKGPGRWKVIDVPARHKASFIGGVRETCVPDCPLTRGKDGMLQLWSPKPLALSQLEVDTVLILATIDPTSLELKASNFRNKELAGLERGECKIAGSGVKSPEPLDRATKPTEAKPSSPETTLSTEPSKPVAPSEPASSPPTTDKKE